MVFKNDVIFTGRLNINDLKMFLVLHWFTYVSYFEGFGILL